MEFFYNGGNASNFRLSVTRTSKNSGGALMLTVLAWITL
jgi:hypothetical protein